MKKIRLNIRQKLQFFVLVSIVIVFAIAVGYISIRTKSIATRDATNLVNSHTEVYAAKIESYFNADMAAIRTLAHAFNVHIDFEEVEEFRSLFKDMYEHIMRGNRNFYAIWDSWEYNHIDPDWDLPYGRIAQTWWWENNELHFLEFERSLDGDPSLYSAAKRAGRETIWEPYLDQIDEGKKEINLMTTLTVPMFHNSNYIGLVGLDITLERLQEMIENIRLYENSYAFLVSYGGTYAAHPNSNLLGSPITDHLKMDVIEHDILNRIENGEAFSYISSNESNEPNYYAYHPVIIGNTEMPWSFAIAVPVQEIVYQANRNFTISIIVGLIGLLIIGIVIFIVAGNISKPLQIITNHMRKLAKGHIDESMKLNINTNDEIEEMASSFNISIDALMNKTSFATSIGGGDLNTDIKLLSDEDILGKALIDMRDSLRKAEEDERKRKEEDSKRTWANEGFTLFADILRQSDNDIQVLSENVIAKLVNYLKANQGGLFILNDDDAQNKFLQLKACYAFDRKKFNEKQIRIGEGLVGTCFVEQKTIFMTKVPENYISITSGLGGENPRCILIVPLKLNEEILGVIEIASFKVFEPHQIEFVEKIAENIASSISSVKINAKTAYLLEQSQQQAEEMRAQEEEMRQNMEEMNATQEEMARKEAQLRQQIDTSNKVFAILEYDTSGKILKTNNFFRELTGYSESEITGKHHSVLFEKDHKNSENYQKFWQQINKGEDFKGLFKKIAKDGSTIVVKGIANPIMDDNGNLEKVIEFFVDITKEVDNKKKL